jgi:hypothetical protein
MADVFLVMVYLGGLNASHGGFRRSVFWPYYLGRHLVSLIPAEAKISA